MVYDSRDIGNDNSNVGLTLALVNLAGWLIPIVGVPVGSVALYYAIKSIDSSPGKSWTAIIIAVITIAAAVVNSVFGVLGSLQQ